MFHILLYEANEVTRIYEFGAGGKCSASLIPLNAQKSLLSLYVNALFSLISSASRNR